jgi:hypothetical protein
MLIFVYWDVNWQNFHYWCQECSSEIHETPLLSAKVKVRKGKHLPRSSDLTPLRMKNAKH